MTLIDPTVAQEFQEFAVEALKAKTTNLRLVIHQWKQYLDHAEGVPIDIRQDAASRLVIALLATQVQHDDKTIADAIQEIRSERH